MHAEFWLGHILQCKDVRIIVNWVLEKVSYKDMNQKTDFSVLQILQIIPAFLANRDLHNIFCVHMQRSVCTQSHSTQTRNRCHSPFLLSTLAFCLTFLSRLNTILSHSFSQCSSVLLAPYSSQEHDYTKVINLFFPLIYVAMKINIWKAEE